MRSVGMWSGSTWGVGMWDVGMWSVGICICVVLERHLSLAILRTCLRFPESIKVRISMSLYSAFMAGETQIVTLERK